MSTFGIYINLAAVPAEPDGPDYKRSEQIQQEKVSGLKRGCAGAAVPRRRRRRRDLDRGAWMSMTRRCQPPMLPQFLRGILQVEPVVHGREARRARACPG